MTQSWTNWRDETFGPAYHVWHDGPNWSAIYSAFKNDPDGTDRMLVAGIAEKDHLAAESISRLAEEDMLVPLATAALAEAEVDPTGDFALRRAETLYRTTGDDRHLMDMLRIVTGSDFWGVRINAALALGKLEPTAEAIDALELSAHAEDYLVRYHSANALLRYAGETTWISDHELFGTLVGPGAKDEPTDEHREGWKRVAHELAEGARNKLAG